MTTAKLSFTERDHLERDVYDACAKSPAVADLLISAFVAALRSYRRGSVCAPFPGFLINDGRNKEFKLATELVAHIPPTREVAASGFGLSEGVVNPVQKIPLQALRVFRWVLQILQYRHDIQLVQDLDETSGSGLPSNLWGSLQQDLTSNRSILPSHVLKIQDVDGQSSVLTSFEKAKAKHGSITAFHGTRVENLHSILHSGLLSLSHTHLQRNGAMLGEGVYFSTDFRVAFSFSQSGDTWEKSCFGPKVRYLLCCEIAKGEGVTWSTSDSQEAESTERKREHQFQNPASGTHGTYVVVVNSAMIRIRLVLIYCDYERDPMNRSVQVTHTANHSINWSGAISRKIFNLDRFTLVILLYVGMMLLIGFSKSGLNLTKLSFLLKRHLWWIMNRMR